MSEFTLAVADWKPAPVFGPAEPAPFWQAAQEAPASPASLRKGLAKSSAGDHSWGSPGWREHRYLWQDTAMASPSLRSWKMLGFSCGTNVCKKENKCLFPVSKQMEGNLWEPELLILATPGVSHSAKEGWYRVLGRKTVKAFVIHLATLFWRCCRGRVKGSLLFPREQYDLAIFRTEEIPSVLCQMTVDRISCYMGYPLLFHHGELL